MRTMYDSVRPSAIPADAEVVAGYVDGIYAWTAADWARFPNAVRVEISAVGTNRGTVVDVEVGCVWPPERAVPWVQQARARRVDPTVYCNWQNDLASVKAAFIRAGVPEPHYWVAKYDGIPEVPAGTVGKQYQAPEAPGIARAGGHYDVSSVADYWPGVDQKGNDVVTQQDKNDIINGAVNGVFGRMVPQLQFAGGKVAVPFQAAVELLDFRTQSTNDTVAKAFTSIARTLDAQSAVLRQIAEDDDRVTLDPADLAGLETSLREKLEQQAAEQRALLEQQAEASLEQIGRQLDELTAELTGKDEATMRRVLAQFFGAAVDAVPSTE